jgi:hypothetical protein
MIASAVLKLRENRYSENHAPLEHKKNVASILYTFCPTWFKNSLTICAQKCTDWLRDSFKSAHESHNVPKCLK